MNNINSLWPSAIAAEDFQLPDQALAEALRRVRRPNNLFTGHKFWISKKTLVKYDDLRNLVTACGGEVRDFRGPRLLLIKSFFSRFRRQRKCPKPEC